MAVKLKHSKIKNTGIIFELLMRQITADTLENKESKAIEIAGKFFTKTELAKEYKIYEALINAKNLSESKGDRLINTAVDLQKKLSQSKLKKEKYSLISAIKESYDIEEFFKAKIDNYKILASIYMLFEASGDNEIVDPTLVSGLKTTILESVSDGKQESKEVDKYFDEYKLESKENRLLIYKILISKFNEKYNGEFNDRQKDLLKEYINNVSITTKLKDYINEKLVEVKTELKVLLPKIKDKVTQIKVKQVTEIIQEIPKTKNVTDDDVINLFNYLKLVEELNEEIKK